MTLESWNTFFQVVSGIALGLTFFAGIGAIWTGYSVSRRQTERVSGMELNLMDARLGVAAAERDLELLRTKSAQQQERAAEAERKLEEERAARLKLDQRTANRWLETETINALSSDMARYADQPAEVVVFPVNFESVSIAGLIHGILLNAKASRVN